MSEIGQSGSTEASTAGVTARLQALAHAINGNSRQCTRLAVEIGEALMEAKGILPHGAFLPWVGHATEYGARTAQNMMNLATLAKDHRGIVNSLTLSVAYRLAAPSTSDAVRTQMMDAAGRGETITLKAINNALKRERDKVRASIPLPPAIDYRAIIDSISTALTKSDLLSFSRFIDDADPATINRFKSELRDRAEKQELKPAHHLMLDA